MQLILGSQSPRRREIFEYFNLPFQQISPNFDETSVPFQGNPIQYVQILSKGKAESLDLPSSDSIIVTADTVVFKEGKIYNKPINPDEAFQFLKELTGGWHSVLTGITVKTKAQLLQTVEETRVLFHPLTDEQIYLYHQMVPYHDKAGGYMIQGAGGLIVNRIEGCYYNVVGLPLTSLCTLLKQVNCDLWNYLKGC